MTKLLTVAEAAAELGVAESTIRHRIKRGYIPVQRVGRAVVISARDLTRHRLACEPDGTLSVTAAAERLGLTLSTVRTLVRMGRLVEVRAGDGRPRVTVASVDLYAETRRSWPSSDSEKWDQAARIDAILDSHPSPE